VERKGTSAGSALYGKGRQKEWRAPIRERHTKKRRSRHCYATSEFSVEDNI